MARTATIANPTPTTVEVNAETTSYPSPAPSTQPQPASKPDRVRKSINVSTAIMPPPSSLTSLPNLLHTISTSPRGTPFDKKVWSLLLQIPAGQVSTYALLAQHLHSSPRAVGNALRRNPFAPEVPCHRVVATGGGMGGFKGKSGREGEGTTLPLKRKLLRGEGVRFDARGGVLGTPFGAFA
jgi:methylated-DNA-[protein]-cysteine S-methyltransferase